MVQSNSEQCIINDDDALPVIDEDKKIAQKSCRKKFLNTEFARDRNILSQADTVCDEPRLIDKDVVIELISKMKNGKAAEPPNVVPEMVKAAGEAVDMITELVNEITVEGAILAEWELGITLNVIREKAIL